MKISKNCIILIFLTCFSCFVFVFYKDIGFGIAIANR